MLIGLTIAAAVVLVVLVALFLVRADGRAARRVERQAGELLAPTFGRAPVISIEGRPFLTQAVRGRYPYVRVEGEDLRVGPATVTGLDARLHNTYLSTRRLLRRRVDELTCERLSGWLVLPYAEVERLARVPGLRLRYADGRLFASARLPVPGLGQVARVDGEAGWTLVGAGSVYLRIRGVSVAGVPVPTLVTSPLLPVVDVPVPLPELPFGLRIENLLATPKGLVVSGSAAAPVFRWGASTSRVVTASAGSGPGRR